MKEGAKAVRVVVAEVMVAEAHEPGIVRQLLVDLEPWSKLLTKDSVGVIKGSCQRTTSSY